jgi:hypothetical protein
MAPRRQPRPQQLLPAKPVLIALGALLVAGAVYGATLMHASRRALNRRLPDSTSCWSPCSLLCPRPAASCSPYSSSSCFPAIPGSSTRIPFWAPSATASSTRSTTPSSTAIMPASIGPLRPQSRRPPPAPLLSGLSRHPRQRCLLLSLRFPDYWAINRYGLTDPFLSHVDVPSDRPPTRKALKPLPSTFRKSITPSVPGRNVFTEAIDRGIAPDWVVANAGRLDRLARRSTTTMISGRICESRSRRSRGYPPYL